MVDFVSDDSVDEEVCWDVLLSDVLDFESSAMTSTMSVKSRAPSTAPMTMNTFLLEDLTGAGGGVVVGSFGNWVSCMWTNLLNALYVVFIVFYHAWDSAPTVMRLVRGQLLNVCCVDPPVDNSSDMCYIYE